MWILSTPSLNLKRTRRPLQRWDFCLSFVSAVTLFLSTPHHKTWPLCHSIPPDHSIRHYTTSDTPHYITTAKSKHIPHHTTPHHTATLDRTAAHYITHGRHHIPHHITLRYAALRFTTHRQEGNTALHIACKMGNVDTALALLRGGADGGARNKVGVWRYRQDKIVQFDCLANCVDWLHIRVFVTSQDGLTAKDLAEEHGHTDLEFLLVNFTWSDFGLPQEYK